MLTLIKNGLIVTAKKTFSSDILIENEKIKKIGKHFSAPKNAKIIDAKGMYIFPGGVDAHTHFDLEVADTKSSDNFGSGSKAAAFGGTTTIIDYAHQEKGGTLKAGLNKWLNKAKNRTHIDYAFHLGIVDWNKKIKKELKTLPKLGITSIKCYMAYPNLMVSERSLKEIIQEAAKNKITICIHAEDGKIIEKETTKLLAAGKTGPQNHPLSHPVSAELSAIKKLISLLSPLPSPLFPRIVIVHLSSKKGLALLKRAKLKFIIETCPQYLVLNDQLMVKKGTHSKRMRPLFHHFESAKYVLSPPLRKKQDNISLLKGLRNTIDYVATDHCPFNFKTQKTLGIKNFTKIPGGIGSVEHRLQLLYTYGVLGNHISLNRMVELFSTNPAKIFNLYPQKGEIKVGSDADLIIFDPKHKEKISVKTHHQNIDYSAYEGIKISGRPKYVFLRGKLLVKDKHFLGKPDGKFLKRHWARY